MTTLLVIGIILTWLLMSSIHIGVLTRIFGKDEGSPVLFVTWPVGTLVIIFYGFWKLAEKIAGTKL